MRLVNQLEISTKECFRSKFLAPFILQVCDTNGLWYLADIGLRAGDLLLVTGRALQHITAGLCKACTYRVMPLSSSSVPGSSRRLEHLSVSFLTQPPFSGLNVGIKIMFMTGFKEMCL